MNDVNLDQFLQIVSANSASTLCIDVRSRDEYEAGHIQGVRNIPLGQLRDCSVMFDNITQVYLHCKTGHRACQAAEWMQNNTNCDVFVFSGGYEEYTNIFFS